jgi:hypothetical protein
MRSVDFVYAAAIVALFVWLVLGASNPPPELDAAGPRATTDHPLAPVSAPGALTPAPLAMPPAADPPRVAASATIDDQQFEILVGEGSPPWSVAVSVDD